MAAVQYQSLQIAEERDALRSRVEELERERRKVERIKAKVNEVMEICPKLNEEHPYLGDVFDDLKKIVED